MLWLHARTAFHPGQQCAPLQWSPDALHELPCPLRALWVRHQWAVVAYSLLIPVWCIPQKLGSSEKVDERITDDDHETWIHCKTSQICPTFTVSSDSYRAHWLWNVGLGCGGRIRGVKNETLKLRNAATLDGLSDQHFAFCILHFSGCRFFATPALIVQDIWYEAV